MKNQLAFRKHPGKKVHELPPLKKFFKQALNSNLTYLSEPFKDQTKTLSC